MTEFLTASQMRAVESAAIGSGAVTGLELMERAGQGVVEAIFETWPEMAGQNAGGAAPRTPRDISSKRKRAVVLCGPGNNGGDGFVVARLLAGLDWDVQVFLLGDAGKLPPDARRNHDRWCGMGAVTPLSERAFNASAQDNPKPTVVVDAVFGTGLTRGFEDLSGVRRMLFDWHAEAGAPQVVSVDIASGLCADSGRYLGRAGQEPSDCMIAANLTVSFHRAKLGHVLADGPAASGHLVIKDIGLGPAEADGSVRLARVAPGRLAKGAGGHKYGHGHAVVLSGSAGLTGAARLAARGALRVGAGLVTLGVPPAAQMEVANRITALMMTRVEDGPGLARVLEDGRINALCLGPGLGLGRAGDLVPVALAARRSCVLDADGLSAFATDPQALFSQLHRDCVLTPHGGEFARLFPDIAARLTVPATRGPAFSKVDATREAAARAGCVVLFKGADTVIAAPDGAAAIHAASQDRAAPWLATAGSGDVLAGMIAGLMARGLPAFEAAQAGAWLHVECARTFGPGLIAEDLPDMLPAAFRAMGL